MFKPFSIKKNRPFLILLAVMTIIRVFYSIYLNLLDDEAYYWEWGQYLDLSYLDHPPMIAWIGRLFTSIIGNTELGVRMGPLLLTTAFLILAYRFTLVLYGDYRIAFHSALLLSVIPVFSVGSFMLLPDAPLSLFWLLSIGIFHRILSTRQSGLWLVLGLVWGLGMLSKYNMILLPVGVGLFLLSSSEHRFWLARLPTWLGLTVGIVVFSPVILWNIQNDWPSFSYHLMERNKGIGLSPEPLQLFLAGQFLYLSPLVFIAGLVVLVELGRLAFKKKDHTALFLFTMSAPYILAWSLASALSPTGKPHWPALGYTTVFMALPWFWERQWKGQRWQLKLLGPLPVTALAVLTTAVLYVQSVYPLIPLKPKIDMTNELYGWPEAGKRIQEEYDRMSRKNKTVVFTRRLLMTAQVGFYTPGHIPAYSISDINEQYDIWGRGSLTHLPKGADGIYVADSRFTPDELDRYPFERMEALPPLAVKRAGKVVREFYLFRFYNFQGE